MNILFITPMFAPSYAYGGPPRSSFGLVKALQACGHSVAVITSNGNGRADLPNITAGCWTTFEGVKVNYLQRMGKGNFLFTPGLISELNKTAPGYHCAIVKATWTYFNWAGTSVLRKLEVPYFEFVVGAFDEWAIRHHSGRKKLYWRLIEQRCYRGAAGIIALSENEELQVQKMGLSQPIAVIPNGVDIQDFDAPLQPVETFFPQLKGKRYLLFLGRLHVKKGIERLIEAFSQFQSSFSDVSLVIAGDGEEKYTASLKQKVTEAGLEGKVLFTGWVTGSARSSLLKSAYCFILPSFSEGLPMGVLDAMAFQIPVIITPECYLPGVADHHAGFIVKNDPEILAEKITLLLNDFSLRSRLGENGLKYVMEKHSWRSVANRVAYFTQSTIENK